MEKYGYVEGTSAYLTKENILERISQEDIFKMVFGSTPEEHKYIKSPFREDKTPDCYFEWYKDILYFIDWAEATKRKHRDCFNAIQDTYGVSFFKSLEIIATNIATSTVIKPPSIKREITQNEKVNKDIPFKARAFNNAKDREFWSGYGITKANLMEDEVFPVIWYKIFSKRFKTYVVIRPNTRSYIIGNFGERIKIYTPDIVGQGKWVTNCNQNDIGGNSSLITSGPLLVITKSYKDYRVLKNQGLEVRWFQNEGQKPCEEYLLNLVGGFEKVVVFYDNDNTGIKASAEIAEYINTIYPNKAISLSLPIKLLKENISDPSDLYKIKGEEELQKFLRKNKLIT
jgi:hypothetical protein